MIVRLTTNWELSTEHAASNSGQPVLVQRSNGKAHGPGDIVKVYAAWGSLPAARAVERLADAIRLDADEQALVARFVRAMPPPAAAE